MCCSTLMFLCNSGQKIITFLYTSTISHKGSRPQICFFTSPQILLLFSKLRHQSHALCAASSEQDHTRLSAIHKTRSSHYVCHFFIAYFCLCRAFSTINTERFYSLITSTMSHAEDYWFRSTFLQDGIFRIELSCSAKQRRLTRL